MNKYCKKCLSRLTPARIENEIVVWECRSCIAVEAYKDQLVEKIEEMYKKMDNFEYSHFDHEAEVIALIRQEGECQR